MAADRRSRHSAAGSRRRPLAAHPGPRRCRAGRRPRSRTPPASAPVAAQAPATPLLDGAITSGASLGPVASAACVAARLTPPPFASLRNEAHASEEELRRSPYPYDCRQPMQPLRPDRPAAAAKRKRLPPAVDRQAAAAVGYEPEPSAGCTARPAGRIAIAQLFLVGVYDSEVQSWLLLCDAAVADVRAGRTQRAVPTRVIPQSLLQPWARGTIWDCRDPSNCVPVARSDRHTVFPGARQLDRSAVRRVAAEMDWEDSDLLGQIGEGGVEVRSDCSLDIVLAFNHDSFFDELEAAGKVVEAHIAEEWVAKPTRHLPFVPCRLQPRGVVMQSRTKPAPDGGGVCEYLKPRVTTDSSFGGLDSVNGNVRPVDRGVELPSAQKHARAWGIVSTAAPPPRPGAPAVSAEGYVVDAESAYSFLVVQVADWWLQAFVWWDEHGKCGFAVDTRMGFGGAFGPNRFQRTSLFACAYIQRLQAEFDADQPPPAATQAWCDERRRLQRIGELPPGFAHALAMYLQSFIDDFTGVALNDRVVVPAWISDEERAFALARWPPGKLDAALEAGALHMVGVGYPTAQMVASGCVPSAPDSRVGVHARLAAIGLRRLGFVDAIDKAMVGSPLPLLGLRADGERRRLDCPDGKRDAVLADAEEQLEWLGVEQPFVDRRRSQRLVGRLCSLSQVAPALRPSLHGGYAVTRASWMAGGRMRSPSQLLLAQGSSAHTAWMETLCLAVELVGLNAGVSLAPPLHFPERSSPGALTCTSDASGVDGIGAYAFLADKPGVVWVLSELWPAEVRDALAAAADEGQAELRQAGSHSAAQWCSTAVAELFGHVVLPAAIAEVEHVHCVFSIGDCSPATAAVTALHSGNPKLRAVLPAARRVTGLWLGVHVKREYNRDCDRLSHPERAEEVVAEAERAGLEVRRVRLGEGSPLWSPILAAVRAEAPTHRARRRRQRARLLTELTA